MEFNLEELDEDSSKSDLINWKRGCKAEMRELISQFPLYPDSVGGMYPYEIQMYSADVEKVLAKLREFIDE